VIDKASYRNRRGLYQRLVSAWKLRHFTDYGTGCLIKPSVEIRCAEGAVLEIGDDCTIQDFSFIQLTMPHPKVFIGDRTVIGRHNLITAKNLIRIGSDVLIGSYVQIIDHGHGIARYKPIRLQQATLGEVVIGDDVWIGAGAKILKDVHIGDGAVIGANSVVTSDVAPYSIVVGAPARVIGHRS